MNPIASQFTSIEQVTDQYLNKKQVNSLGKTSDISFEDILRQQQSLAVSENSELKFSKHAASRLESGVVQAEAKGIQESLVLVDSLAFIVNVPNKTVVTAMDQTETQNNVFTNIDGAVIM